MCDFAMPNLIRWIEGLEGEELASALLAYALHDCGTLRRFLARIGVAGEEHLVRPPHVELRTQGDDEITKWGFADVDIETQSWRVIIEDKFWANFSTGQPNNYLNELSASGRSSRLVLLAPRSRLANYDAQLRERVSARHRSTLGDVYRPLAWEDVVEDLVCASTLNRDLVEYLRGALGGLRQVMFTTKDACELSRPEVVSASGNLLALIRATHDAFPRQPFRGDVSVYATGSVGFSFGGPWAYWLGYWPTLLACSGYAGLSPLVVQVLWMNSRAQAVCAGGVVVVSDVQVGAHDGKDRFVVPIPVDCDLEPDVMVARASAIAARLDAVRGTLVSPSAPQGA